MTDFNRQTLERSIPNNFLGIKKERIIKSILSTKIQHNWNPKVGDIIADSKGNMFILSSKENNIFFFGGTLIKDNDNNIIPISFTLSETKLKNHFSFTREKFRYVPRKFSFLRFLGF